MIRWQEYVDLYNVIITHEHDTRPFCYHTVSHTTTNHQYILLPIQGRAIHNTFEGLATASRLCSGSVVSLEERLRRDDELTQVHESNIVLVCGICKTFLAVHIYISVVLILGVHGVIR